MTLQSQLDSELTNLGGGAAVNVAVDEQPRQLACEIIERNSLAVSFNSLRLSTSELANSTAADLERIGKSLSSRLTYLMEPISPIELDPAACVVQLRSSPPQKDDDGRSYYELMIRRGGEISLRRFRKESGASRQPIAANVTREVLLRLVGDFCAVLG